MENLKKMKTVTSRYSHPGAFTRPVPSTAVHLPSLTRGSHCGMVVPTYSRMVRKVLATYPLLYLSLGAGLLVPYAGMLVFSSSGGRSSPACLSCPFIGRGGLWARTKTSKALSLGRLYLGAPALETRVFRGHLYIGTCVVRAHVFKDACI